MMLLGFQGDASAVTEVFRRVDALARDFDVDAALRLQASMVFHTGFGVLNEGVKAAQDLIVEQRARGNVADLFRAHCNAAVTFRIAGLFERAEESLLEALQLADKYNLDHSALRAVPMLANMALELGKTTEAQFWYDRLRRIPIHPTNTFGRLELGGIGARLALLDGNPEEALRRWEMTRVDAQSDPVFHRRAYNCALQVAIDLALYGRATRETLNCLVEAYERSKTGLHQAYSAAVVYAAFIREGETQRAERHLRDYVRYYRRESWPLPSHLVEYLIERRSDLPRQ